MTTNEAAVALAKDLKAHPRALATSRFRLDWADAVEDGRVTLRSSGDSVPMAAGAAVQPDDQVIVARTGERGEIVLDGVAVPDRATDTLAHSVDVLRYQRFNPQSTRYGGTVGRGQNAATRTTNTAAWQQAADDAAAVGGTFEARGEWEMDGTVQFRCHVNAGAARVYVDDDTIAPVLMCGGGADYDGLNTAWIYNRDMLLPQVIQEGRTKGTGVWSGTDVGVAIVKLMASRVTVPYVDNFSYNLVVAGYGNAASLHWGGTAYNTITLGKLYDGKVALDVSAGHSLVGNAHGWANENLFIGGQFRTEDAAEGTAVSGARYIRLTRSASSYPVTNNLFLKPSVENDFPQYHVEFNQAQYNQIVQGRYEPSNPGTTTTKAYFSNASDNLIHGGYQAEAIEDIAAGGTTNTGNLLITPRIIRPLAVTAPVAIDFVAGTVTFDESVTLYSDAANVLRTDDSLRIPAYPQYTRIGNGYLWDSGTELRQKYGSAPASATDGTAL